MINEAHREYVLSAPLGRKKSTETDKKKSRDQHKNGLDPKTGLDHPKSFDLGRFSPTKFTALFLSFLRPLPHTLLRLPSLCSSL